MMHFMHQAIHVIDAPDYTGSTKSPPMSARVT